MEPRQRHISRLNNASSSLLTPLGNGSASNNVTHLHDTIARTSSSNNSISSSKSQGNGKPLLRFAATWCMVAPVGLIVLWCISVAWRSATLYDGSSLSVSNPSVVKVAIQIDENTLSADATKRTAAIRPLKRTKATTTNELHQKQKTLQPSTSDSLHNNPNVLTLFLEPPSTLDLHSRPLARRRTTASKLTRVEFPKFSGNCDYDSLATRQLPIDDFPEADPFLPWLHDYHVDASVMRVRFVAQNKRRCETGTGKEIVMKYWEPQVALFQPVPVIEEQTVGMDGTSQSVYRLATSPTNATAPETRFLCRFHLRNDQQPLNDAATRTTTRTTSLSRTTFSTFDFNYEFIMWRKRRMPMFHETGSDVSKLEMSQLLFSCPIPDEFRPLIRSSSSSSLPAAVLLDLVPIRTPTRQLQQLFTEEHIGASSLKIEQGANTWFNASAEFGMDHVLPDVADSGRWANLPLCPSHAVDQRMRESYTTATNKLAVAQPHDRTTSVERSRRLNGKDEVGNVDDSTASSKFDKRRYSLVACTWTAASYFRRGDATVINDSTSRLKEWIVFHQLAGVEHFYVYDNTKPSEYQDHHDENMGRWTRQSPLRDVCSLFPSSLVTHIAWPASMCSNNRPNFQNPGERSSQYSADAACRSNYGEHTEWMTFLDTDEYLVPMRQQQQKNDPGDVNYGGMGETMAPTWQHVLRKYETQEIDVLKLKSSRGRPRLAYMDVTDDPSVCVRRNRRVNKLAETTCAIPSRNTTFLQVYNCDYIKHPRPYRFSRAMKQIYRPAKILSHFVHYSIATTALAKYYADFDSPAEYEDVGSSYRDYNEIFLDELTEGVLLHAKSVLPHETMTRTATCRNASRHACEVGHECPDEVVFEDEIHRDNLFHDSRGKYCNCWVDDHVERYWVPLLEAELTKYA